MYQIFSAFHNTKQYFLCYGRIELQTHRWSKELQIRIITSVLCSFVKKVDLLTLLNVYWWKNCCDRIVCWTYSLRLNKDFPGNYWVKCKWTAANFHLSSILKSDQLYGCILMKRPAYVSNQWNHRLEWLASCHLKFLRINSLYTLYLSLVSFSFWPVIIYMYSSCQMT